MQVLRKRREVKKVRHETHALRMDMMYRLSLAKHVGFCICITSSCVMVSFAHLPHASLFYKLAFSLV